APAEQSSVGGTLVDAIARMRERGLSNCRAPHYGTPMILNQTRLIALLSAIAAAAALRLVPHPPNFSPIGAMALFSGAYLGRRALAFVAPLGALLLSDLVLGFYHGQLTVYFSVALVVVIGMAALRRVSPVRVGVAAI